MFAGFLLFAGAEARALPLVVTTTSLDAGAAGTTYADTLAADLGTLPYAWTLAEGLLPTGLTLDGVSGEIAGTPTLAGVHGFVALVTDALGDTASRAFTISIAPGAPSALSFLIEPSAVIAGATIAPAVEVKVVDAFGNGIAGESVSLALTGPGTLSGGGSTNTDPNGVASFAALSVDLAGTHQLSATSGALSPATSASFTVSAGAVASLAFAVQPTDALVGVAIAPAVEVLATDAFANPVPGAPVTLALSGSGVLSGGAAQNTGVNGIASFAALSVDVSGSKQLEASSGVVGPVASSAFTIQCAAITLAPATLPNGPVGAAYSATITASGGSAPYSFAVTAGALPSGLSLAPGGALTGTPTVAGPASFTVTATDAAGCSGALAYSFTIVGVPAAVTNLAVARTTSGNDADGTIKLAITFTPATYTDTVEVYRAPYGGYPRYDDAGGLTPPTPSYPPGSPWTLTAVGASGQTDEPASRDAYSYVVFAKNEFNQVSAVSNKTAPTPGYALGDVSNGFVAGTGDNLVSDLDVSLLGAHYGISGTAITTAGVSYLDVGPTVDFGMSSRPFTDGRIDFEDLIVFATNYGDVSAPASLVAGADAAARAAQARETFRIEAPQTVAAGETFEVGVVAETFGRIQGLSGALAWDAGVVECAGMQSAGWLESQRGVVWSAEPGQFDAALLGARARGLSGTGAIARFTFRAKRAGDPGLQLARLVARDAANRTLGAEQLAFAGERVAPVSTTLLAPSPNPSPGASRLSFALARAGVVELVIYSIDGRRVRTLAQGAFAAGTHGITWDGLDDAQHRVAAGVYFARLAADGRTQSKMLVQLR